MSEDDITKAPQDLRGKKVMGFGPNVDIFGDRVTRTRPVAEVTGSKQLNNKVDREPENTSDKTYTKVSTSFPMFSR